MSVIQPNMKKFVSYRERSEGASRSGRFKAVRCLRLGCPSAMRFVHSSIAGMPCCTAASSAISGVPSLGVSSLDLGPHGNPVAALFFVRGRITRASTARTASVCPHQTARRLRSELPKTATKMSRAQALSMLNRPIFAAALVRPRSLTYLGSCPIRGVSSLDLGRRLLPRGPLFYERERSNLNCILPAPIHGSYIPWDVKIRP